MNQYDKSIIIPLKRIEQQFLDAVRRSDPSVEDQHSDGIKIGRLYGIQTAIKVVLAYEQNT
jgi:hypothetical protein